MKSCSRDVVDQWTKVDDRSRCKEVCSREEEEGEVKRRRREVNMGRVRFRLKVGYLVILSALVAF